MPQTKAHEDLLIVDELRVDKLKLDSVEITASADEINATFSGAIGDNLNLIASGGFWYITGAHQVSIA